MKNLPYLQVRVSDFGTEKTYLYSSPLNLLYFCHSLCISIRNNKCTYKADPTNKGFKYCKIKLK